MLLVLPQFLYFEMSGKAFEITSIDLADFSFYSKG